jgi:hypothetical protein
MEAEAEEGRHLWVWLGRVPPEDSAVDLPEVITQSPQELEDTLLLAADAAEALAR